MWKFSSSGNHCTVLEKRTKQNIPRNLSVLYDREGRLSRPERLGVEPEESLGRGHLIEGPGAAVEADGRLALHQRRLEGEALAAQQPQQVRVVGLRAGQQERS